MARRPKSELCSMMMLLAILCFGPPARAGKLDAVREAVHGERDECRRGEDRDQSQDEEYYEDTGGVCEDCGGGGDTVNPWWFCLIPPVGLLVCLPKAIIESPEDAPGDREEYLDWIPSAYFTSHPYADGHKGYLFTTGKLCRGQPIIYEDTFESFAAYDPGAERIRRLPNLSSWSLRLAAEYAYDVGPVHRPNLSASFDSIYRIGLTTRWTHYIEPQEGGAADRLTIGDVNIVYRVAHSDRAEARLGLGIRMIFDGGFAYGLNAVYTINIFPVKPLVLSLEGDLGSLGKALYLHARATVGAQLGPAEPYLGYDLVRITGDSADVLFHGPVAGIRIWM